MNKLGTNIVTIAVSIIGLATLAVLVSNGANTANVIKSIGDAFSSALRTAVSPVR